MRDEYDFSDARPNPFADRLGDEPLSTPTTRGEQPASGTLAVFKDDTGRYRWRLEDPDGRILTESPESYATLDECRDALARLTHAMADPATVIQDAA